MPPATVPPTAVRAAQGRRAARRPRARRDASAATSRGRRGDARRDVGSVGAGRAATAAAATPRTLLASGSARRSELGAPPPRPRRSARVRAAGGVARARRPPVARRRRRGSVGRAQHVARPADGAARDVGPSPARRAGAPSAPRSEPSRRPQARAVLGRSGGAPRRAGRGARVLLARARRARGPPVESVRDGAYYVTTPIYYVNSTPHIGHAYTTVAADVFARHQRQRGQETFLLTGVDEHASKVARVAAEQGLDAAGVRRPRSSRRGGRSPPASARERLLHPHERRGPQARSSRSSSSGSDNGDVYQDVYAGLYCVGCEAFKTEDELVDGKCPEHDVAPEWIEETNWFFRLSAYQDRLLALYDERPDFVLPGLPRQRGAELHRGRPARLLDQPRRTALGHPDPVGSGAGRLRLGRRARQLPERAHLRAARRGPRPAFWPEARHLLAKDILRFHCVYWPAMLLAAGYDAPQQLFVHGYLLLDDRKISKSLGNVVDPLDLIDLYGADALRFWCARSVSFGQDAPAWCARCVPCGATRHDRRAGCDGSCFPCRPS